MDRRLIAGVATAVTGLVLLGALVLSGSLRHPATATTATHPAEFVAIGVALGSLTVGIVATFVLLVEQSGVGKRE